jgi:hypothetical protein
MNKRFALFSISLVAIVSLMAGCSSKTTITTSSTPPTATSQSPASTSTFAPTTSITGAPSSTPPTSTEPVTTTINSTTSTVTTLTASPPPTSAPLLIIRLNTAGSDNMYATVKVGTKVRWTGGGEIGDRTVVSETPGLFGGLVTNSPPYCEYTFNTPGVFYYTFAEVANYRASITVTA